MPTAEQVILFFFLWGALSGYTMWYLLTAQLGVKEFMDAFADHWEKREDRWARMFILIAAAVSLGMIFVHLGLGLWWLAKKASRPLWPYVIDWYYLYRDDRERHRVWLPARWIFYWYDGYQDRRARTEQMTAAGSTGTYIGQSAVSTAEQLRRASKIQAGEDPDKPGALTLMVNRTLQQYADQMLEEFKHRHPEVLPPPVVARLAEEYFRFYDSDDELVGEYDTRTFQFRVVIDEEIE